MMSNEISAVILAAGYSSRMGDFKPLMRIGRETALEKLIGAHKSSGIKNILVVTGHNSQKISAILNHEEVIEVHNPDYDKGMFSSIIKGLSEILMQLPKTKGCFLSPVDSPMIPKEAFSMMAKEIDEGGEFAVPCYRGKKGHPLWIPARYIHEILDYNGKNGLKGAMKPYEDKIIRIETGLEGTVLDMDTPEGYREILEFYQRDCKSVLIEAKWKEVNALEEKFHGNQICVNGLDIFSGRLFFVRHGQTEQHKEKVFLGQTDVLLNEEGKEQSHNAAKSLAAYSFCGDIYSSPLKRARETADIIGGHFEIPVVEIDRLSEISLGGWDGRYIREIKDKFPGEYEKRGKNMLQYKMGNNSENYYDLQYRAIKGLAGILIKSANQEKDTGRIQDVAVVAHIGVIRVLIAYLAGTSLDKIFKIDIPKGGVLHWSKELAEIVRER